MLTHKQEDVIPLSIKILRTLEISEFAIFLPSDPIQEQNYRVAVSYIGARLQRKFTARAGMQAKITFTARNKKYPPRYLLVCRTK